MSEIESDDPPFESCEKCGQIYRAGARHVCSEGGPRLTAKSEGRRLVSSHDDRADDDEVVHLTGRTDSAYHEVEVLFDLDAMLAPRRPACGTESHGREWKIRDRSTAKATGRYPCKRCSPDIHEAAESRASNE